MPLRFILLISTIILYKGKHNIFETKVIRAEFEVSRSQVFINGFGKVNSTLDSLLKSSLWESKRLVSTHSDQKKGTQFKIM